MMRGRDIFISRLIKGWKYQYGVVRSIADWTIMLYIIIPAIVISFMIYRSWWTETPAWIENMPFFLLFFVIYLFSWNGNIRTYVMEADKVFLIKKPKIFLGMKKWGYAYSLLFQAISMGVSVLILLPFVRNHYHLPWQQIIALLFYFIALSSLIILIKFHLRKIEQKFKKIAFGVLLFIALSWFSQLIYFFWEKDMLLPVYLTGVILMAASISQSLQTIRKAASIEYEIDMGQEEKTKNIQLMFMLSHEIEKPIVSKRTKPLFFRHSKRIFKKRTPVNGFIELFIKIFLRNFSYIRGYFQIISVTTAAIVMIPPLWIKIVVFIGFLIMMHSWLSLIWEKVNMSNPLTKKYSEMPGYFSARKKTVITLFILAILFLTIFSIIGFTLYSMIGIRLDMNGG